MTTENQTETKRTRRIHNIAPLKERIKALAADTRSQRVEARALTGMDRHWAKESAKGNAHEARYSLLAYGYLRGRTIDQMESEHTRKENFPSADSILAYAEDYFGEGPEATPEDKATWDEFAARVRKDIQEWKGRCLVKSVERKVA